MFSCCESVVVQLPFKVSVFIYSFICLLLLSWFILYVFFLDMLKVF